AERAQRLRCLRADHRQLADRPWRKERGLIARFHEYQSVRLARIACHFGDELVGGDARRSRDPDLVPDALPNGRSDLRGLTEELVAARDIEIRLVRARGLHDRREVAQDGVELLR